MKSKNGKVSTTLRKEFSEPEETPSHWREGFLFTIVRSEEVDVVITTEDAGEVIATYTPRELHEIGETFIDSARDCVVNR